MLGELLRGTGERAQQDEDFNLHTRGSGEGLTLLQPGLDLETTLGGRNQVRKEKSKQEIQACG